MEPEKARREASHFQGRGPGDRRDRTEVGEPVERRIAAQQREPVSLEVCVQQGAEGSMAGGPDKTPVR